MHRFLLCLYAFVLVALLLGFLSLSSSATLTPRTSDVSATCTFSDDASYTAQSEYIAAVTEPARSLFASRVDVPGASKGFFAGTFFLAADALLLLLSLAACATLCRVLPLHRFRMLSSATIRGPTPSSFPLSRPLSLLSIPRLSV